MIEKGIIESLRAKPGKRVQLKDWSCDPHDLVPGALEEDELEEKAREILDESRETLSREQQVLYANDKHAILVIFQAMDAAGKDGTVRHVMSGVNPQGCHVTSFKQPSDEELDHDYLWRCVKALPERGRIGIFNRSYYEEVLVVRVHPEILASQKLPSRKRGKDLWKERYEDINNFERYLSRNGTTIVKFFLHVSKKEQKRRFLSRMEEPDKRWKFSEKDVAEREFWNDYRKAYEDAISATSTKWAPWYIIPADKKWAARCLVADILATTIRSLKLDYPELSREKLAELQKAKRKLEAE